MSFIFLERIQEVTLLISYTLGREQCAFIKTFFRVVLGLQKI